MAKCPADFDFFAPEVIESPFEFYRVVRDQAPVYLLPGTNIYMLTKLADIRQAAKDTATFSSDFLHVLKGPEPSAEAARIYASGLESVSTLLTLDPPRHKVYRSLINKVFSAKRVEKMHEYIEQIADELIDSFIERGECEFVEEFATALPVYVIADQLGVPRSDLGRIKAWSDAFASMIRVIFKTRIAFALCERPTTYRLWSYRISEYGSNSVSYSSPRHSERYRTVAEICDCAASLSSLILFAWGR